MIKRFDRNAYGVNTYAVWNPHTNTDGRHEAMVVDAGHPPEEVVSFAEKENLQVKYIVLTHGHYDHVCYLPQYRALFPSASVICHEKESAVLGDEEANVSFLFGDPSVYQDADAKVNEGDVLTLCGKEDAEMLSFKVLHTPGHTPGCICLYCASEKLMLTGDTLFDEGCGRTDFKYGNPAEMIRSLRRLYAMDPEITFYSGHGDSSIIRDVPRLC